MCKEQWEIFKIANLKSKLAVIIIYAFYNPGITHINKRDDFWRKDDFKSKSCGATSKVMGSNQH